MKERAGIPICLRGFRGSAEDIEKIEWATDKCAGNGSALKQRCAI
jgi:hypothetical protein